MLSLNPADETAVRHLMRVHDDRGETGRALDVYMSLWNHLDDECGQEPSLPTQELVAAIKSGSRTTAQTEIAMGGEPSGSYRIGVLPVTAPGQFDDARATGDLFRTELISRLVRFRELDVIDTGVRKTETDYALKLSVSATSEHLALIATFTGVGDGRVVWSDRPERLAHNWWDHQANLAGRLAAACSQSLSRTRLSEVSKELGAGAAVDHWLLGQKLLNDFRADRWTRSADCFRQAIDLDPELSMAYSNLSQHHNIGHLVRPGRALEKPLLIESKALIALDPLDSRAHLCRRWASCLLHEHAPSAASFAMARQCNQSDPWTVLYSALSATFSDELSLANALAVRRKHAGATGLGGLGRGRIRSQRAFRLTARRL